MTIHTKGTTLHVDVVMGGWSSEYEVSMRSGHAVVKALQEMGYHTRSIVLSRDLETFISNLTPRPDVVFNALHGTGGEDGMIQSVLEILGIPYTHSNVLTSSFAMNKPMTKHFVESMGVRVPEGVVVPVQGLSLDTLPFPPPMVTKPVANGSTVGVRFIDGTESEPIFDQTWEYGEEVLVEAYIPGRELTVGVMGTRALGVTEISFSAKIFDYTAKYTPGYTKHLLPAPIPAHVYETALEISLKVHKTLNCRGVTRTDFRYDDRMEGSEGLYFLEINTQPGLTSMSLVPEQAAYVGIPFNKLILYLIQEALS